MTRTLLALLFLLAVPCEPAFAQDVPVTSTDPFDMPHPTTHEPGAWIPRWLQAEQLKAENDLKVCYETGVLREQQMTLRADETRHLTAALEAEKQAAESVRASLASTSAALSAQGSENRTLRVWVWALGGTTVGVVLATTAVVVFAK